LTLLIAGAILEGASVQDPGWRSELWTARATCTDVDARFLKEV
jgi:hypothetical protein